MVYENQIWVGTSDQPVFLLPGLANRHGLISGATGTGKTVTLQVLAEGFSALGVPVFMADVKGDLSGMVKAGEYSDAIASRLSLCGVPGFLPKAFPAIFWDVYGELGHPVRATVSQMGPVLLSRILGLNETQSGVLNILFHIADDEHMLLLDIKDLKAMLRHVGENAANYKLQYGNIASATIGAIQRAVAVLEDQGGDRFFGEPALNIDDWMAKDEDGNGLINILAADRLFRNPTMYSTFMLWMLSEIYERLPEVGDLPLPKMVFFFDEAHLLFNGCPKVLLEKIDQLVRLIRSKGVGVFFITQSPSDIPASVLTQLGNRVQHALRAYTPLDQKAVRVAAQTFRANPKFDTEEAITNLHTGEALISFLDAKGAPGIVQKVTVLPPQSQIGAVDETLREQVISTSPFFGVYDQMVDRKSAYEMLVTDLEEQVVQMPEVPSLVYEPEAAAPVTPAPTLSFQETPTVSRPQGFMVYDPVTGSYVQKELPGMTPAVPVVAPQTQTQTAVPQAPVLQVAPEVPEQPQVQQMQVMVFDPTTGQYVQKLMTMQLDPATGNYVPVQPAQAAPVDPKAAQKAAQEAEKARKAAEKAEKERLAEERRKRADELREERAARARKNDSVVGRITNTAISTASREVTKSITRGIMGSISGLFGGSNKK